MLYEILVTGGAGFIGSNLVRQLQKNNRITVVDDLSEGHKENLDGANVDFRREDIRNRQFMRKLFEEKRFGKVFHLAASFANQKSVEHPEEDLETNGAATLDLLQLCQKHRVKKFVYASSSCVYGATEKIMQEDLKPNPETPYGITKLLGEYYTQFFHQHYGLDTTIVRYFNIYGPFEHPGPYRNVIPKFLSLAFQNKPLLITGTGEESRDFTFVDDAVYATMLASEKPEASGEIINIGTGRPTSILDLAGEVNKAAKNNAGVQFVERRSWDHIEHRLASVEKMKSRLGVIPQTTLKEGLRKTAQWFEKTVLR